MNIILLAPPLSGKGTQASLLKNKLNLVHISIGDMLRKASQNNDDLAKKINEVLSSGALVSDDLAIELLEKALIENKESNGFVFDGFPRTIPQAEKLDELFNELNLNLDYVFLLNVDVDTLEKRITGRRVCMKCNRVYNIYNSDMMPKVENICDNCESSLIIRSDDNLDSFKVRYQEYLDKTYPIIEYYKNKGNLIEIDATKNVDEVFENILSIMKRDV